MEKEKREEKIIRGGERERDVMDAEGFGNYLDLAG